MKNHLLTTIVLVCTCMLSTFTCGCSSKLTSKEKNSFDKSVIADLEILNEKEANAFQKIREFSSLTKTDSVSPEIKDAKKQIVTAIIEFAGKHDITADLTPQEKNFHLSKDSVDMIKANPLMALDLYKSMKTKRFNKLFNTFLSKDKIDMDIESIIHDKKLKLNEKMILISMKQAELNKNILNMNIQKDNKTSDNVN
ncbi:hypothetical protein prwr041_11250 [Prevotella herbatica]|uniref:Lipoprotein n=1 Tax=Prevotella herbatica TaxID=2801997 RepID=A0ABN6EH27_9BACT|nr:hypothetical protein [Prevotella herbatica]BCS85232.1 hypothetical protein prwr041_11250 [Prevotella herbatica]